MITARGTPRSQPRYTRLAGKCSDSYFRHVQSPANPYWIRFFARRNTTPSKREWWGTNEPSEDSAEFQNNSTSFSCLLRHLFLITSSPFHVGRLANLISFGISKLEKVIVGYINPYNHLISRFFAHGQLLTRAQDSFS